MNLAKGAALPHSKRRVPSALVSKRLADNDEHKGRQVSRIDLLQLSLTNTPLVKNDIVSSKDADCYPGVWLPKDT